MLTIYLSHSSEVGLSVYPDPLQILHSALGLSLSERPGQAFPWIFRKPHGL
jgi:hypothetical protein